MDLKELKSSSRYQLFRYLVVGGLNTVFGYAVYAAFNYLLLGRFPYSYLVASILSTIICNTYAYIGYKFFVFRTRGNYLSEYIKFYAVYGLSIGINLVLLPVVVVITNKFLPNNIYVTYIAGAILIPVPILCGFFGHKRFSFRA
ncbi:MAG: GtrA family protein [Nitrospirae bacterium]|nr:GtrA family protein [Nitrospirota bacterium]